MLHRIPQQSDSSTTQDGVLNGSDEEKVSFKNAAYQSGMALDCETGLARLDLSLRL